MRSAIHLFVAAPCFAAALASASAPGAAQQVLDVRILEIAARIPAPPTTVEEGYRRAQCDDRGGCSVTAHYAASAQALEDVRRRLQALHLTLQQPSAHPLANVDPAELQRRLAAMSPDEQIRFAQEMARASAGGAPAPEPPAVQRLLGEATKAMERTGAYTTGVAGRRVEAFNPDSMVAAVRAQHDQIRARTSADISALPQPPAYAAEPVIAEYVRRRRAIEDRGMQERFAAEQAYQQALADAWKKELARLRDFYGAFEDAMANTAFGAQAVGVATRTMLLQAQTGPVPFVEMLLRASTEATERGADLWLAKLILERERTRD